MLKLLVRFKTRIFTYVAVLSAGLWLVCEAPTVAHRRDFPVTYDWFQPGRGEKEIELHSRYRNEDASFQQQVEFEYGISKRLMVAPYLVFEKGSDGSLHYDAFKLESRYQLGRFGVGKVLPGLYLEYEQPSGATGEVEAKLILSRYGKRGDNLSLNLVAERPLRSGRETRTTYSFGYARPLGNSKYGARGGLEWVRDIDDGRLNAGPVLAFTPLAKTWVVASYGFPINNCGHNAGEFRLLAEYEWF